MTVFGAFQLSGKDAYDKAIDGAPNFIDPPELQVVRMVEQGDIVMVGAHRRGETRRRRRDAHVDGGGIRHARRQNRRAARLGDPSPRRMTTAEQDQVMAGVRLTRGCCVVCFRLWHASGTRPATRRNRYPPIPG